MWKGTNAHPHRMKRNTCCPHHIWISSSLRTNLTWLDLCIHPPDKKSFKNIFLIDWLIDWLNASKLDRHASNDLACLTKDARCRSTELGCYTTVRSTFFSERIVNTWNILPADVDFSSIVSFVRTVGLVALSWQVWEASHLSSHQPSVWDVLVVNLLSKLHCL